MLRLIQSETVDTKRMNVWSMLLSVIWAADTWRCHLGCIWSANSPHQPHPPSHVWPISSSSSTLHSWNATQKTMQYHHNLHLHACSVSVFVIVLSCYFLEHGAFYQEWSWCWTGPAGATLVMSDLSYCAAKRRLCSVRPRRAPVPRSRATRALLIYSESCQTGCYQRCRSAE